MRILIPSTWIPHPPWNGARLRTWEIARRLARQHEIVFALHLRGPEDFEAIEALRDQGFGVIAGPVNRGLRSVGLPLIELLRGGAPVTGMRRSRKLEDELARDLPKHSFDIIQVEHEVLASYPFLLPRNPGTILAITLPDLMSESYARIAAIERSFAWRTWRRINARGFRRVERTLLPRYDVCVTVSERDRTALSNWVSPERIAVFPNGVDLIAHPLMPEAANSAPVLLFVGHMQYVPNADAARWLVRDILPRIRLSYPGARLMLVGGCPPCDIESAEGSGVTITGHVPDLGPFYQQADVILVPIRAAGGTRLKILEAMARGRPVISTSSGAEGLDIVDGQHLVLAETSQEIADATIAMLRNPRRRREVVRAARALVESRYGWDDCAERHLNLYRELTEARRQLCTAASRP
jgi:glycosyltransferase involved in cell wall biosynthesis